MNIHFFHKTMFFLLPFFVICTREFIYFLLYFNSSSERKVTFHASIAFHMHIHNNENEKYFGWKKIVHIRKPERVLTTVRIGILHIYDM